MGEFSEKENDTMMKSRYAAWDLQLDMKVNNVEYQGDGSKAIFIIRQISVLILEN